jgi:SHS2 domain-containing protein
MPLYSGGRRSMKEAAYFAGKVLSIRTDCEIVDCQNFPYLSWRLLAKIGGERMDLKRHAFENEVKAITMHQFQIKKNDHWCIQVILDV